MQNREVTFLVQILFNTFDIIICRVSLIFKLALKVKMVKLDKIAELFNLNPSEPKM